MWIMPFNRAAVLSTAEKFCGRNGKVTPIWRILPSAKGKLESRFCSLKSSTDAAWRKKMKLKWQSLAMRLSTNTPWRTPKIELTPTNQLR